MRTIHYAGGEFVVTDQLAAAIMDYAMVLAQGTEADLLTIPTYDDEGAMAEAQILIGPASQIMSSPRDGVAEVAADTDILADIGRRAAALRPARPAPEELSAVILDLDLESDH